MTVTMSLGISTWMSIHSNFFKVMNASGGVIGTWASNCILDAFGRWLRVSEGRDDFQRPHTKY